MFKYHYENFCVQCPQGCINCGRKQDLLVTECGNCGRESTTPEEDGWDMENEVCDRCREEEEEE